MAHIPSVVFIGGVWDCPLQHVQQSVHRRSLLPGWLGGHRWGLLVIAIGDRLSCWKIKNLYRNRYNTPVTNVMTIHRETNKRGANFTTSQIFFHPCWQENESALDFIVNTLQTSMTLGSLIKKIKF